MGLMLRHHRWGGKRSVFANKLIENGVLAITAGKMPFVCSRRSPFQRKKWMKHSLSWQSIFDNW